jgi:2,3-bisphosphoglycerate-dependent phosphoglycerate mutase
MLWRRSYDVPPPPIAEDDEFSQAGDPRYAGLGPAMPATECLKDVVARLMPYWENEIQNDLADGLTVMVAAHGNSLRALVKTLDEISDEDIAGLNIPTGMPLVYELDEVFRPVTRGGRPTPRTTSRGHEPDPGSWPLDGWGVRRWCAARSRR